MSHHKENLRPRLWENLNDALRLHFMLPVATVLPKVRHIELDLAV